MAENQSNNFVYESSRYKILMEDYPKLSADNDYIEWGKKAQVVAAYISYAISRVNTAIAYEKDSLVKDADPNIQKNIKMGLMQYEGFIQILRTQLENLIKVMNNLPTGPVKPFSKEMDKSKIPNADSPYVKVFVSESGEITLDGKITTPDDLKNVLTSLAQRNGVVLYSRESPEAEAPTIAKTIMTLVAENRLPIRLCKSKDFSDAVDSNGKLRINE